MIVAAEVLRLMAIVVMMISSGFYVRHSTKTKKRRKLSPLEYTMYISLQIAYLLFAIRIGMMMFIS